MIAAVWIAAGLGLAAWSLVAWALYALLQLAPGWAERVGPWLDGLPAGEWLERWMPGWREIAIALADLAQALITWAHVVIGPWLGWLIGGAWAAGTLLMLATAGLMHWVVRSASKQ
jgi:hypothetical protein